MSHRTLVTLFMLALILPAVLPLAPGVTATGSGAPAYTVYDGPSGFVDFPPFAGFGGEPSLGVDWETGTILYQHGFQTFRVTLHPNGGSTWEDVTAPNTHFNVDPMLFTDSEVGRSWAGGLDGACSFMAITDDGGHSWLPAGNMCVPTLDHQTIASGPFAQPVPTGALWDRATYYCAQAQAVTCITSLDGGFTWGPPVPVACSTLNPAFHGSVHVAANGHVFLPFKRCGPGAGFAVSTDNGLTWTARQVPGATYPGQGFDPDVGTTPSGWTYFAYAHGTQGQGRAMVTLSKDNGTTFSTPVDVGAPLGVLSSTFHEVVAGDDDRAAVAFIGTTTPGNPFNAAFAGVWHLYIATTYDAGATWTTVQASTDPVQRGWICSGGTGCSTGRNLLDFMDAQVDTMGRILVAHADGCIDVCALPGGVAADSTDAQATIVRQSGGRTLFSRYDQESGAFFATGHGPYTAIVGTATPLSGAAANGVAPYTYSWSVLTRPDLSDADASSFSSTTAASPTFTPDALGDHLLRFEARDANGAVATDIVTLTAVSSTAVPFPSCSTLLANDAAGDTLATGAGAGRRDLVAFRASDTPTDWTLCARVANMADAPTTPTRFTFLWAGTYEAPGILYSATATVNANGGLANVLYFKGAVAITAAALGGPAFAAIEGDTLRITLSKSAVGAPAAGETATNLRLRVESTDTTAITWDSAPNTGGTIFTFGAMAADNVPPTAVATLAATDAGTGGRVDLAWSASSDNIEVQDYVVRRSTVPGGPYRTAGATMATSFSDRGLTDGVTYHYIVSSRDTAGNVGAASPEASATPTSPVGDLTPPTTPAGLAIDTLTATWALLEWDAAEDPESGVSVYRVLRDGVLAGSTTGTSLRLDGLVESTTYAIEVRAVNGAGVEGTGATLSLTTPARPVDCGQLAAPYQLVADALGDATRADGRADVVRVGVRETASRIWFHVGLENRTASAPATMVRVAWEADEAHGFALFARVDDAGVTPAGIFLTTPAGSASLQKQPQVGVSCESVLIGVQKADVFSPAALGQVSVITSADTTAPSASQIHDAAPDTGGVDYVVGSAM